MSIAINQTRMMTTEDLPAGSQTILELIPNGSEWFNEASASTGLHYDFSEYADLVGAVQKGLHGSDELILKNMQLIVSPQRLQELKCNDIRDLFHYEQALPPSSDSFPDTLTALLQAYKLIPNKDFNALDLAYKSLATSHDAVLTNTGLDDRIRLYNFFVASNDFSKVNEQTPSEYEKRAMDYAQTTSQSATEVIHKFRFYLRYVKASGSTVAPATDHDEQLSQITESYALLARCVSTMLNSPLLSYMPSASQLQQEITHWQSAHGQLGFIDLASGVSSMAMHVDIVSNNQDDINKQCRNYMVRAQQFIAEHQPSTSALSQGGTFRQYTYKQGDKSAIVNVSSEYTLSLVSYTESPQ